MTASTIAMSNATATGASPTSGRVTASTTPQAQLQLPLRP